MRLVVSRCEYICCACVFIVGIYTSPLVVIKTPDNAWEFLLIWDDRENFVENDVIQHGLSWKSVGRMFTMTKINVYEPFGWILKAAVVQIAGLDSWSVRLASVLLHFIAGFVLAKVSALLLDVVSTLSNVKHGVTRSERVVQNERRRHWMGCCWSAMLFVIHPVHVEIVAWPSAQPYTLCALFSNLALYVYVRSVYRKLCEIRTTKKSDKHVLIQNISVDKKIDFWCCVLYSSALLSKSACILLPASFVLIDALVYAILRPHLSKVTARQLWSYIVGKTPMAVVLLAFLGITLASNRLGAQVDADVLSLSPSERAIKALTTPAWILQHILWPVKLRPHYQLRPGELSIANPECLLSIGLSVALMLYTLWLFNHRHAPQHFFALIFFVVMILPVSGLVQHGMVSAGFDRYAYLSSIIAVPYGGAALGGWLYDDELGQYSERMVVEEKPEHVKYQQIQHQAKLKCQKSAGILVVFLLSGALLSITSTLMGYWRNEDTLLEYSLRMDPSDWRTLDQRGAYLLQSGRCERDDSECRRLWELSYHFTPKGSLKSDLQRLKILAWLNEVDRVCEAYTQLLKIHPHSCHVQNNVAICWVHHGNYSKAREGFKRALQTPGYEHAYKVPTRNLENLEKWIALKQEMEARGEGDKVPPFDSRIMF